MNVFDVETFLMIVKTKNITKTAESLFLSQPTVSHRLKTLENELQMQLITRRKGYKGIELTSQGEEFAVLAQRWLALWKEVQMLQQDRGRLSLTVGCTDTWNNTILPPLYSRMFRMEPQLDLHIRTHQSEELYLLLERREIDVGLVHHHLHCKNVIAEPVLSEKMVLVQSAPDGLRKSRIYLKELDPAKEIFFSWETNYQIWHEQWMEGAARPKLWIDSFGLIRNLFRGGGVWMIAPVSVAKTLAKDCDVRVGTIADQVQPPERITYKIRHRMSNQITEPAVDLFGKRLDEYLKENWQKE